MIDFVLIAIALASGASGTGGDASMAEAGAPQFAVEDQTPSGQFLTATEVRPILQATAGSWVAVREYGGQDLVYVTHLLAWRCGLHQIRYSINDGPFETWPMPACHLGTAAPAAILPEDGLPYVGFASGSVDSVTIELLYDDLGTQTERFERASVLMP